MATRLLPQDVPLARRQERFHFARSSAHAVSLVLRPVACMVMSLILQQQTSHSIELELTKRKNRKFDRNSIVSVSTTVQFFHILKTQQNISQTSIGYHNILKGAFHNGAYHHPATLSGGAFSRRGDAQRLNAGTTRVTAPSGSGGALAYSHVRAGSGDAPTTPPPAPTK